MRSKRFKTIRAVFEVHEEMDEYRHSAPSEVYERFKYLNQETREHFIALFMDSKNRVICQDVISIGSGSASIVDPKQVFRSALLSGCEGILLLHNHPSGDTEPSQNDIRITKRITEGAELLGFRMLDHIIVGDNYYSFKENNQI